MKLKQCLQEPSTCSWPEPDQTNLYPQPISCWSTWIQ